VGKVGVAIDSLADMRVLLGGSRYRPSGDAVRAGATLGGVCDVLRAVWGR
jgi:methylmalonyl-CoA mutase N-terminal domain/subunit